MSSAAYQDYKAAEGRWATGPRSFKQSWCIGAVKAVTESINAGGRHTVDRRPGEEQSYGLVPIKAIEAVRNAQFPSLRNGGGVRSRLGSAYDQGYAAGQGIQLHRGLAGKQRVLGGG